MNLLHTKNSKNKVKVELQEASFEIKKDGLSKNRNGFKGTIYVKEDRVIENKFLETF